MLPVIFMPTRHARIESTKHEHANQLLKRKPLGSEFDFIVGYNLFNDTAYVFSFDEVMHIKTYVTISEKYAERWDKLRC